MKKYIGLLVVLLLALQTRAQQEGARVVTASQTIQSNGYTIQVGGGIIGSRGVPSNNQTNHDIRFPWDILYLPDTFSEDLFEVSKGYFGDKIVINWVLVSNRNLIEDIFVYRRVYTEQLPGDDTGFEQITTLPSFATEYEDLYVEGGVLYEYKVEVTGIQEEQTRLQTFITGIGYRSNKDCNVYKKTRII